MIKTPVAGHGNNTKMALICSQNEIPCECLGEKLCSLRHTLVTTSCYFGALSIEACKMWGKNPAHAQRDIQEIVYIFSAFDEKYMP